METDYAIRIAWFLAAHGRRAQKRELGRTMRLYDFQLCAILPMLQETGLIAADEDELLLLRPPDKLPLLDIVNAVEGNIEISRCLAQDKFCSLGVAESCPLRRVYLEIQGSIEHRLKNEYIKDLI
ncbi:MAG: Rrf2 family transcriptional regulator [Oscillospiraceae bacterium]|nr:Rrf2 family transcriptional regulator [Oscillospiraceae bacterium]